MVSDHLLSILGALTLKLYMFIDIRPLMNYIDFCVFLAHLSTKCSVSFCDPSMSVVHACVQIFSSETAYWILTKLHRNDPWVVPYQSCTNRSSWLLK